MNDTYTGGTNLDGGTQFLATADGTGSGAITFEPLASSTLILGTNSGPPNAIDRFIKGDTIVLDDLYLTGTSMVGSTLIVDGLGGLVEPKQVDLNLPNTNLAALSVQSGTGSDFLPDVVVTSDVACFCRGTRILTSHGEIAVEDLVVGDRVITFSGAAKPIRWIGRRSYAGRFAVGNATVLRIVFRAGALAENIPSRDLFVSPLHAMFIEGLLIPAGALSNGRTIKWLSKVERIDYFHIELESHDLIIAEGALSETFVDDDSSMMFHNALEYFERYPDAACMPAVYCAPRVTHGYALEAIRKRLAERAGLNAIPPDVPLRGYGAR